jgi:hypothetical protein
MTGDLANGSYDNPDGMLKEIYKKILGIMMTSMTESPEEAITQFTMMRDSLNEMIAELQNGDATIEQ